MPQPVLMDAPAHAMRVELDCAEVGGTEVAPEPDAMNFPLPLFGPNKAEPDVFLEMWVDGAQVIVDLTTKRSGFGALREIVFAVEEV